MGGYAIVSRNVRSITAAAAMALLMIALPALAETVSRTYTVKGFHCPGCARSVEMVLKETKGVKEAKADFAEGKVEVAFDDEVVTEQEIEKAIKETGFSIVEPSPSPSSEQHAGEEKSTRR